MAADVEEDWGRRVDHWISPPSVVSHSVSAGLFSFAGSFGRRLRGAFCSGRWRDARTASVTEVAGS
jgi:hypothetical protein